MNMTHIKGLAFGLLYVAAGCRAPTDADRTAFLDPARATGAAREISTSAVLKVEKPSLVTTACVNASNQMEVTETWDGQTIDAAEALTLTLSLKRPQTGTEVVSQLVLGPYDPQPSFSTILVTQYIGAPWNTFQSIGASATGAFSDVASTIRQPKTGWRTC
jgi:hypothetical protein